MRVYSEQEKTFDNGRGKIFVVRLFCQGTYDFIVTDYSGNKVNIITAIDVDFVHARVREMRGWVSVQENEVS